MILPNKNDPNKLEIKKNMIQQQLPIFKAKQVSNKFNDNHNPWIRFYYYDDWSTQLFNHFLYLTYSLQKESLLALVEYTIVQAGSVVASLFWQLFAFPIGHYWMELSEESLETFSVIRCIK